MSRPIIRRTVQVSLVLLSLAFSMASPTMGVLRSGDIAHMVAGMPVPEALVVDLAQAFADRDPPGIYMARNKGWTALLVLRRIPDSSVRINQPVNIAPAATDNEVENIPSYVMLICNLDSHIIRIGTANTAQFTIY